ncbi:SDR family oxidoreductase [Herbaspirillum lusitanum]|uniref:SDR family oxidoreductase n=1 Tax=Herbaspirillum lusitanum TaxID=213312 RepID=A0ABW9A8V2_9BURK
MSLENKTLVIIGGTSGIGLRTAQLAAQRGAKVILGGRNADKLKRALSSLPPDARGAVVDSADQESLQRFFADIEQIDMLFTPGASYQVGGFRDSAREVAESPFKNKFWGQYWAVHAALSKLSEHAAIVLMSGAASARPIKGAAAYAAANAAIEGLGRGLATELAPIRVNVIAPGTTDSDLWRGRDQVMREAAFASYRAATLLGEVGEVDDIANAALFLLTNGYMTGSTLFPDGGYALR